jgi:3-phosphoshikimate 1-carboxyvinyltransferase
MSTVRVVPPAGGLEGTCVVPGDKSLAHRALLLGALAEGTTAVTGFPAGADVLATVAAVRALGAGVTLEGDAACVDGRGAGLGGTGAVTIDCANSGTTMRLGAGVAAGSAGTVVLDGDGSLRRRPMERVAEPLRAMGARVETEDGHAPLTVRGGNLAGIDWTLAVASAQVKSAILLAGLRARGRTRVSEPQASRDHTERLLAHFGARVVRAPDAVEIDGGQRLRACEVALPGDLSSAAFLVVAALLVPGSEVHVERVGVNPTRTGLLAILRRMGAAIEVQERHEVAGEPRATLVARAARLRGTSVEPAEVPAAIDELPILCVAAAVAEGETTLRGAQELRVKESDRIAAIEQLRTLGAVVETRPDGLVIRGTGGRRLRGGRITSGGDHRIAMAFAVAGLVADGGVEVLDAGAVGVSFPAFFATLRGEAAGGGRRWTGRCGQEQRQPRPGHAAGLRLRRHRRHVPCGRRAGGGAWHRVRR